MQQVQADRQDVLSVLVDELERIVEELLKFFPLHGSLFSSASRIFRTIAVVCCCAQDLKRKPLNSRVRVCVV